MKAEQYQRQLDRVTEYIYTHLDEDLRLDMLAEVAGFSPYHWHRLYRAVRGESAAKTVERLRLERAAELLMETRLPITRIATRSGFANATTFSRAFIRSYGVLPSRYRDGEKRTVFRPVAVDREPGGHPVEIVDGDQIVLAASRHRGSYLNIGQAFARVRDRIGSGGRMLAMFEDDPDAAATAALRSVAGVVVEPDMPIPDGLERTVIPAGRLAVLHYVGPYALMHTAYRWLYGTWLPASGQEPRNHPVLEEYLTDPAETAPAEAVTRLLLPIC
ncbi:MAG: AraC family transcriptional regulator [Actinobacteria bacterium]|nr:AraC family transcriptional regulator [Actinomycetota bacterium]